jgi:anti-sigma factor RsiW
MDCLKFQDSMTDYLDGAMLTGEKAEFAAHRLRCRECRALFSDVRVTLETLGECAETDHLGESGSLENRILSATSVGEMLSCQHFDRLLERYFDGVILAPTYQNFQEHFKTCHKCRRLMAGIEEAIALCRDARIESIDVPDSLHERILAVTSGATSANGWMTRAWRVTQRFFTPQIAAAALIFAASTFWVYSRFGGVTGMASEATTKAEQLVSEGNEAVVATGAIAISGVQFVSREVGSILNNSASQKKPSADTPQDKLSANADPAATDSAPSDNSPDNHQQKQKKKKAATESR